jgi:glycosyltransferase involved in cell wall biosynthesis
MRRIVTIHDAIPLIVPSQVSRVLALQMAWMLPRVLNDCDVALAVSQWTADWLAAKFPQNSHKITVMPNGFPEWRGGSNLVSRETEPLKALCVSRWESYKRLDRLVDIVQNARGAVQVTLVTDAKGRVYAEENGRDLLAKGWLRLLNGLSDTELTDAYHEHHVYLHPSEWEGFCLPAAEALAHGLSVVYQKGSGIDEVVGPCGIGLSPDASIDDWCETLIRREWNMSQSDIYDWVQIQPKWNDIAYRLAAVYNRSSRLLDKPNFAPRKRSLHAPSVK